MRLRVGASTLFNLCSQHFCVHSEGSMMPENLGPEIGNLADTHPASLTRNFFPGELEKCSVAELAYLRREELESDPDWQSRRARQFDAELERRGLTDDDLESALAKLK